MTRSVVSSCKYLHILWSYHSSVKWQYLSAMLTLSIGSSCITIPTLCTICNDITVLLLRINSYQMYFNLLYNTVTRHRYASRQDLQLCNIPTICKCTTTAVYINSFGNIQPQLKPLMLMKVCT